MIVLPWIWIRELGVNPTLIRGTDPRVLLDLDFLVSVSYTHLTLPTIYSV